MTRSTFAALALLFPSLAFAGGVDPALVGDWVGQPLPGLDMHLKIEAAGRCSLEGEPSKCSAKGGALTMADEEGSSTYRYQVSGNAMTLSGGDLEMPVQFHRAGKGQASSAPQLAPDEEAPSSPARTAPAQAEKAPAPSGPGQAIDKEFWGARFQAPGAWKFIEKEGVLIFGSDTEPGIMLARYYPQATREQAEAQMRQGMNESGIHAQLAGEVKEFRGQKEKGLACDLEGMTDRGEQAKVRVVAMLSPHGGAIGFAAITSADKYAVLKAKLDAMAGSVAFRAPKKMKGDFLAGNYWYYYGSSSGGTYTREVKLNLCRDGRFNRGGELYGSGSSGTAFVGSDHGGTWTVQGDLNGGVVLLQYGNGQVDQKPYRISPNPKDRSAYGPAVYFGSELYQKTGSGDCQ